MRLFESKHQLADRIRARFWQEPPALTEDPEINWKSVIPML
jgi:hypothetical protein